MRIARIGACVALLLLTACGAAPAEQVATPAPKQRQLSNFEKAKAMVDDMAARMEQLTIDVEGAHGDQDRIRVLGEDFKAYAERQKAIGETINAALTLEEKREIEAYARQRIGPLVQRFVQALKEARGTEQGAADEGETGTD